MANNLIKKSMVAALLVSCVGTAGPALANTEVETAELLIKLLQVGRGVISEHQATINDAGKGDKGFTGDYVANQVIERFRKATKIDLNRPNGTAQGPLFLAMVESEKEVIDEAQPVINKQGVGFKGIIPAVFARKAGERFYRKTGIRMKLTGVDYRFPGNRPDDFESEVLRVFADTRHPKGQPYSKATMFDGKPVLRMMDPEYAAASCLGCHGNPKGERDITGAKKEGWKEGDLAGAISIIIPMR
ncbi:MAG: Two-component system sensor histidine kinase [Nitrospira sp.]|jgi:general secretion pathway protein A|nr:MAG: Two-component system sensor histidine kinase [Nitrospira sp.]